jgi:glycosyltransferase involved in cell wall biosynthesis
MLRDYEKNRRRHDLLPKYGAVVTNSSHMRQEYIVNGCAAERVHVLGMPVVSGAAPVAVERTSAWNAHEWHLVFAGRMDFLKGGRTLLTALPAAAAELGKRLRVTFAGEGPDRREWERLAAEAEAKADGLLRTEFVGWKSGVELDRLWSEADLLVVPSLWPEPFGLVGPEAGLWGVPAAAFAVGGIPDWLLDGVNGYLAPGDPPTARGLTDAIVRCLQDPERFASLRRNAREIALRFDRDDHVEALLQLFQELVPATTLHPLGDEPMSPCSLTH